MKQGSPLHLELDVFEVEDLEDELMKVLATPFLTTASGPGWHCFARRSSAKSSSRRMLDLKCCPGHQKDWEAERDSIPSGGRT